MSEQQRAPASCEPAPGEVFLRVANAMEQQESKVAKEARAIRRERYCRGVELVLLGRREPASIPAYTRNLSLCGLGLLCRRAISVGDRLVVLLPIGGVFGKFMLCRVIFCRYIAEGVHEIGTEFETTHPKMTEAATFPAAWTKATAQTSGAT